MPGAWTQGHGIWNGYAAVCSGFAFPSRNGHTPLQVTRKHAARAANIEGPTKFNCGRLFPPRSSCVHRRTRATMQRDHFNIVSTKETKIGRIPVTVEAGRFHVRTILSGNLRLKIGLSGFPSASTGRPTSSHHVQRWPVVFLLRGTAGG